MPLTFLAHQLPVLPLKMRWGRRVDATAMCIGSIAPDLAYPLAPWLAAHSHGWIGLFVWAIPAGVIGAFLTRRFVASVAFAHAPDLGPLRVHSLRVIATRRPSWVATLVGATFGAGSHIFIDGFTHTGRFGSRWLGLDTYLGELGGVTFTVARALQYGLHVFGSLATVALLAWIGHRRMLERWYGESVVETARSSQLALPQRVAFWGITALGIPLGAWWNTSQSDLSIFRYIDAVSACLFAACLIPYTAPRGPKSRRSDR